MVFSQVSAEESLQVKKRLYVKDIDEYNGCSEPLNDLVLSTVLSVIPSKTSGKKLKPGYIVDLTRDGGISPCSLILGLLYIKRLSLSNPAFFSTLSSRELFLVSMLVASKYLNDEGEMEALTNTDFSTIGCLPRKRLDHLESKFLEAIDWKLFVSMEEYYEFVTSVEGRVALNQACQRGWFSYTDLCAVWESSDVQDEMFSASKTTTKVVCGSAFLYLVCVATLFASASHPPNDHAPSLGNLSLNESAANLAVFESNAPLDLPSPQPLPPLSPHPPDPPSLDPSVKPLAPLDRGRAGIFALKDSNATFMSGMLLTSGDNPLTDQPLRSDATGSILSKDCALNDSVGCVQDSSSVDLGHCIESGLFLLLNLTAALTSPDFLTPDSSNCVSSSHKINTLTTTLLSADDHTWNKLFNPEIDIFAQNNTLNTMLRFNCTSCVGRSRVDAVKSSSVHKETAPPPRVDPSPSPGQTSKSTPKMAGNDFEFLTDDGFTERNSSPYPNDLRSPVIVMETVPMVMATPPWDHNFPAKTEKSNFTLIEALGMLAQRVLAW